MEYSFVSWTSAQQPQDRRTQSMVKARVMRNLRKHQHWTGGRTKRDKTKNQQETGTLPRVIANRPWLPQQVCSPSLTRLQLRSKAADLFFGELGARAATSQYLRDVAATNRLLDLTLDAYNLICVGRASGDQTLLHHGIDSYTLALQATRTRLMHIDEEDRKLLMCVTHVFQICEELLATSERSTPNAHTDAQAGLARGLGTHNLTPELQHLLLCNFRLFAIWDALSNCGVVTLPAGEQLGDCDAPTDEGTLITVACISANAPRLLRQARQRRKSPDRTSAHLFCSYVELSGLERQLQRWAVRFHAERPTSRAELNTFVTAGPIEHEGMLRDAYCFRNSATASAYLVYAGTLLAIQNECEAIARLLMAIDPQSASHMRRAPLESIEELCRSLPYFCEPQRGLSGTIQARVPLKLARDACEANGLIHLERWCNTLQTRAGLFETIVRT